MPGALAAASLSSCPCSLAGSIAGLEPESEIRLSSPNRSFSHTSSSGPSPGGYMVECWQCSWSERGGGEGYVTEKICLQRKLLFAHEIILTSQFCSVSFFWGGGASTTSVRFCRENYLGKKISHGKLFLPRTLAQVRAHQPARSERLSHYHLRCNLPSCHT